ncbi:MAG: HPr-rel-A system PqqD family peptide chaperone [Candidatus Riflebacteria bacterium]|nr:HPr-rel-A system PqqD family peptide chaperone [Candidatus Riflebacteria bacterium]
MDNNTKLKLKPSVVVRVESDDYAILYNPDNGDTFAISPSAVSICEHLNGKNSLDEILSDLNNEFEGIPPEAEKQLKAFLEKLLEKNLAEIV